MKRKKIIDRHIGNFHVRLETIEQEPTAGTLHDYGIPRSAWLRAVKFVKHFGAERALNIIDERAMRAGDRRDFDTSRRWRNLITAIHAMIEEERLPEDKTH